MGISQDIFVDQSQVSQIIHLLKESMNVLLYVVNLITKVLTKGSFLKLFLKRKTLISGKSVSMYLYILESVKDREQSAFTVNKSYH